MLCRSAFMGVMFDQGKKCAVDLKAIDRGKLNSL